MSENLGRRLALLRLVPIFVLVALAFGLDYILGLDRLVSAGIGLVAAIIVRLALMRFVK